jgi:hypothetical protein
MKKLICLFMILLAGCVTTNPKKMYKQTYGEEKNARTVAELVRQGAIKQGMTPSEVEARLGKKYEKSEHVSAYGTSETWIYRYASSIKTTYVYFDNGKVSSWSVV